MGGLWSSMFPKKDPKTPIEGCGPRIKNVILRHHKGLLGTLVPIIVLPMLMEKNDHAKTVMVMWLWMAWFFLFQPVNIPATGLIPIFVLPMLGAMTSDKTCICYMNEGISLFILGNMVLLLWNNSGLDRRIMLWFLCAGDTVQFSAKRLVYKCCTASFFLSMFSNRLIVCNIMTQYVTPIMTNLQAETTRATEPDFDNIRYIINSAIQTSCSIGGIAIIHSSFATLAFLSIFTKTTISASTTWHDMFNYLEYSTFALPLALVMLIFNCVYHFLLVNLQTSKPISAASMNKIRTTFMNHKKSIPRNMTLHEKLSLFFSILSLVMHFFRWNKHFSGWAKTFHVYNNVPGVRDATVAGFFAILLHSLPNGYRFLKIWSAKKKSEFGPVKPESAILWWRFVDKNIIYGYIFLIGSGVALTTAIRETKLSTSVAHGALGSSFNGQTKIVFFLLVSFVSVLLANIMTGVAAVVTFLPFVMHLFQVPAPPSLRRVGDFETPIPLQEAEGGDTGVSVSPNLERVYLGALAVGIASSCGFTCPFLYTPAYFCHYTGKVPKKIMAKLGIGSAIICCLVLWLFISFYAPVLWSSDSIKQELVMTSPKPVETTTVAP